MSRARPSLKQEPRVLHPAEWRLDATAVLTLWLVLLYGLSARQVFGPLGAIGQPALMLAMLTVLFWVAGWLLANSGLSRDPHPMRIAFFLYLSYMIASYGIAMARPLTELESSGAHRSLITIVAMCGIGLFAADGVADRDRLTTLLRRLVIIGALFSLVGILQFLFGSALQFRVPGLSWQGDFRLDVGSRSIFNRPYAYALHPIEFGVIAAALLPLAIHFSLYDDRPDRRHNLAVCAALIAFAMPLSIARSGIVAAFVGLGVLALGWGWRRRLIGLAVTCVAIPLLWMVVPGLVGTFRSLFRGIGTDPSTRARIDRVPRIMEHIREYPWFGRGSGTWSVEDYFLIDNQFWVSTLETGVVGMAVTFAFIGLGIGVAFSIRSLPLADDASGHLGWAVGASIAALTASMFTFDAFYFRILTSTLFLLLGVAGALWRLNIGSRSGRRRGHGGIGAGTGRRASNAQGVRA